MKLSLSLFSGLLVAGLTLLIFVVGSVAGLWQLERQNQQNIDALTHNLNAQILQLQQKQRLWLQSQYYLLNTLVESPGDVHGFQSFLWDYYQQNPGIWAVNLVRFNEQGQPVSKSIKPGCLQPDQMRHADFENYLVPSISSCRVDDKALLEIAGPVTSGDNAVVLLVSMDYFEFLNEFQALSGRKLQRTVSGSSGVQYREFGLTGNGGGLRITIPMAGAAEAEVQLLLQSIAFWPYLKQQLLIVLPVLLCGAFLVWFLLRRYLVSPLLGLAQKMRFAALTPQDRDTDVATELGPGLEQINKYFRQLLKLLKHDPVTGLNNRTIFEDRLAQSILEGKRSGRKYALVLIDLPGLEDYVHQRGQYMVDGLLQQVAIGLQEALRASDHVARFERNLFAILLEVSEREQINALVEKIYLTVTRRYLVYGREFELSPLFGVAIYPDHAVSADMLYQHASAALVVAERDEWPIQYFHESGDGTDISSFTLIQELRRAIERDELKLVYQPVVALGDYRMIYLEALLRWKNPDRHDVSIERTIRLAEQNHLIKPLTNWVIETACRFIAESGIEDLAVGINLSMMDLHDRRLPEHIQTVLNRYQVSPAQILIEITEGQIMQDPGEVADVLAHLGVMGLSLSIDDFGTGQASLTYLRELPVEKLKIDQSFVRDIDTNPDDRLIVKATIELAHTLDLKVVAEGVETLAVCNLLAELNCDQVQGYYISRPLEAEQVASWINTSVKPDLVQQDN